MSAHGLSPLPTLNEGRVGEITVFESKFFFHAEQNLRWIVTHVVLKIP